MTPIFKVIASAALSECSRRPVIKQAAVQSLYLTASQDRNCGQLRPAAQGARLVFKSTRRWLTSSAGRGEVSLELTKLTSESEAEKDGTGQGARRAEAGGRRVDVLSPAVKDSEEKVRRGS